MRAFFEQEEELSSTQVASEGVEGASYAEEQPPREKEGQGRGRKGGRRLLQLDQEKAFDRVLHDYLWHVSGCKSSTDESPCGRT